MDTTQYFKSSGKQTIAKLAAISMILSLLLMGGAAPAHAEAAITFNLVQFVPIQFSQSVSCAAGGAGEVLDFSGTLQEFIHGTLTGGGRVTFSAKAVPNNLIGVGRTTGDVYRFAGEEGVTSTYGMDAGETWMYSQHYLLVRPGDGIQSVDMVVQHKAMNANGEFSSVVENITVECR
jgi:hypothetical protein